MEAKAREAEGAFSAAMQKHTEAMNLVVAEAEHKAAAVMQVRHPHPTLTSSSRQPHAILTSILRRKRGG